uniref:Uncharacterized protein n=1 Tax=Anguilla anguilla TaxID=7936 RepID=A0A0E9XNG4_ANGAN
MFAKPDEYLKMTHRHTSLGSCSLHKHIKIGLHFWAGTACTVTLVRFKQTCKTVWHFWCLL